MDTLAPEETLSLNLSAEKSRFCRFNRGKVRQDGTVSDAVLHASLLNTSSQNKLRHLGASASLSLNFDQDCQKMAGILTKLRNEIPRLPDDPYARIPHFDHKSHHQGEGNLLPLERVLDSILSPRDNFSPTGIYSSGQIIRGQANSVGSRHWFSTPSWVLDYSLYGSGERAWKGFCGGSDWNQQDWIDETEKASMQLDALERPSQRLQKGEYRVYLAPSAVADLLWFLGSIFGEAGLRQKSSPLCLIKMGRASFSSHLNFSEDFTSGDNPRFTSEGELIPKSAPLVIDGQWKNTLVGPRSSQEYGIPSNGAGNNETVRSALLGTSAQERFSEKQALQRLDTGLYISNLHYLNWSDRPKGRITGMTRYAFFWVKKGRIKAPVENLRWDDSLFRLFGSCMEATTDTLSKFPSCHTYGMRSVGSNRCPGIMLKSMSFTL